MAKYTLEQAFADVLDSRMRDLHTCMPGRVESYDAAKQTAAVQPMLKRVDIDTDGDQVIESYPVLANVPVVWPRFGGFFIHGPLTQGDFVLLSFAECAIDPFRARGTETHPGDLRRHTMTGAVAIPGLYPRARALPSAGEDLVIGQEDGTEIRITASGDVHLGANATEYVALASKVHDAISTMLGEGIGATGTAAFAAAKLAWDAAVLTPLGSVAADITKAE